MMSLECGLRRKERELTAALKRRDGVIREQVWNFKLILFFLKKITNFAGNHV